MQSNQSINDILDQFNKTTDGIDGLKLFKSIDFNSANKIDEKAIIESFNLIANFLNSNNEDNNLNQRIDINVLKYYLTNFEDKIPINVFNSFIKRIGQEDKCGVNDIIRFINSNIV